MFNLLDFNELFIDVRKFCANTWISISTLETQYCCSLGLASSLNSTHSVNLLKSRVHELVGGFGLFNYLYLPADKVSRSLLKHSPILDFKPFWQNFWIYRILENDTRVHSVCLRFRLCLSLSLNANLATKQSPNDHSTIQTQTVLLPNYHLAIRPTFANWLNGNSVTVLSPNCHLAIKTQIQMHTESEVFRKHDTRTLECSFYCFPVV